MKVREDRLEDRVGEVIATQHIQPVQAHRVRHGRLQHLYKYQFLSAWPRTVSISIAAEFLVNNLFICILVTFPIGLRCVLPKSNVEGTLLSITNLSSSCDFQTLKYIQKLIEVKNRSVTSHTALRFGHWFGTVPQFSLNLQTQFGVANVNKEFGEEIRQLPTKESCELVRIHRNQLTDDKV